MRKFGIVLKYELKEYFSSKGFMVLTFVIAFLGAALLFLPRFIDMSDFTGVQVVGEKEEPEEVTEEDMTKFAYIDLTENGVLQEELLQQMIPDVSWHKMNSLEELKQSVEEECDAGFAVTGPTEYDYYVFNKSMMDSNTAMFDEVMKQMYRLNYCAENGLDLAECGHCTGRVQKALEALEGVDAVTMSLENKTATVELSAEVSDEALTAAVTEAGYEVKEIRA